MNKKILLSISILLLFVATADAQQFKWARNGSAKSLLSAATSISVNGANETWAVAYTGSSTQFKGAGNGTAPDIGTQNVTNFRLVKYDANMNLVWIAASPGAPLPGAAIAADPNNPSVFYIVFQNVLSTVGTSYSGLTVTGQPASYTVVLAKCTISGTSGLIYNWVRKIDGTSDESIDAIKVKDIGSGNLRIAILGNTRSPTVTNYTDGTTGVGQTVTTNNTSTSYYDHFVSCYDGNGTPLWINDFGIGNYSEYGFLPFDMNDQGDVLFCQNYSNTALGTTSFVLNNNNGGATNTTTYSANVNSSNRIIFFNFNGGTGAVNWVYNQLANASMNLGGMGIATDASLNVYLQGYVSGTAAIPSSPSIGSITAAGGFDLCTVVFDNTGNPIRAQRYGGTGNEATTINFNNFALNRTNNLMYMVSTAPVSFTNNTATVQVLSGNAADAFILCANSTGTMAAVSAVTLNGSVAGSTQHFGAVTLQSSGDVVALGDYAVSAQNRQNANTTPLFPKTAYGYQDVTITRFTSSTLAPVSEGTWGGLTNNNISAVSLTPSGTLISAGTFGGALTVGGSTVNSTTGITSLFIAVTDTATGTINAVYSASGNINTCDMKVSPLDGSIYLLYNDYTNTSFNGGPAMGVNQGGSDVYLVKLNSSYVRQWTVEIGGGENDNVGSIAIDPVTGDVFISGVFNSPTLKWVNNSNTVSSVIATNGNTGLPTSGDVFVAKFNAAGILQWISNGGNPTTTLNDGTTKGLSLVNGKLYFGGSAANGTQSFVFGGNSYVTASTTTNGSFDLFLTQIDPSTGNANWIKSWGGNSSDVVTSIATYNNLIYVGGYSASGNMALGAAGTFATTGSNDGYIFSVDATGTPQTGLAKIGGAGAELLSQIATDAAGNLFYAGYTGSSPLTIGGNAYATTGGNDWLVGCVDATTYNSKFAFVSGSVNNEALSAVVPGKLGMMFVGGNLLGVGTFGTYTLTGHTAGDYAYARIDYPYIAPGAVASNLNAWYKANALLTGNPATAWTNSTTNNSLTTLTNTGTVAVTGAGSNFNPSLSTIGGTNYLSQSGIYSSNFTDAGANHFSVYTVYKPASSSSSVGLWNETTTNTGIALSATGTTITGTSGAKTATNTTTLPPSLYSLSSAIVNGTTASNYLNGGVNGTVSGVTPLNTSDSGNFTISGANSSQVVEVISYGTSHTASQPNMNRIDTYLGLKYGITLTHHYYSSIGDTLFNADGTGTTFVYDNNIAGIGRDDNEVLDQRQSQSQNTVLKGNMLTIAQGSLAVDNISNTNTFAANNSYLVWGDDAVDMTTIAEQTTNLPALNQYSTCPVAVKRLRRSWKFKNKSHAVTGSQLQYNLASLTISGSTTADFALLIDNDANGSFSNGTFTLIPASSYDNTTKLLVFNNVNLLDSGVMTVITKQYTVLQATINGSPDSATICAGSNVALTVVNGPGSNPSYSWTSTNGYTSSQQSPAITGAGVTYAGNYIATAAGGTCTANTVKLIVNALPSVSLNAGPAIVCLTPQGQVSLTATPGAGSGTYKSYAWTGPGITTATTTVTGNTARPTASGNYTVTVTDSTGCKSTTATAPVTVDAPTPVIGVQCFNNANYTTSAYLVEMGSQTYPNWTWAWTTTNTSGLFYTTRNTTRGTGTSTSTAQGVYINTTGTYNVTITDNNNCTATVPQVIYGNSCTTLAVNLLDFTAQKTAGTALLNWYTTTEINNSHFEIERSSDGNNWVTIGTLPGHGTTNAHQQYVYTDEMPVNGINYYRLKQVDADGTFSYSETRTLSFAGTWALLVYPNPVIAGKVYVQSNEALAAISILNINGQVVTTIRLPPATVQAGTVHPLSVGNFLPGVYLVQVTNTKGYSRNLKLVKTNR